jgi:hypothetical protein
MDPSIRAQALLDEFVRGWLRRVNDDDGSFEPLHPGDPIDREAVTMLVRRGFFGHPESMYRSVLVLLLLLLLSPSSVRACVLQALTTRHR